MYKCDKQDYSRPERLRGSNIYNAWVKTLQIPTNQPKFSSSMLTSKHVRFTNLTAYTTGVYKGGVNTETSFGVSAINLSH